MKKYFTLFFIYLILALIGGVFYREFTKAFEFTGKTTLSIVHVHFFCVRCCVIFNYCNFKSSY